MNGRSFLGAALLLGLVCGCTIPAPFFERGYVRGAVGVADQGYESQVEESDFPLAMGEILGGYVVDLTGQHATSVEGGGQIYSLDTGGDLDGRVYRFSAGFRRTYRMERQFRPSVSFGGTWTMTDIDDDISRNDAHGPGAYVGLGADHMLTPRFGIGVDGRYHLFYSDAHRENDVVGGIEALVYFLVRF